MSEKMRDILFRGKRKDNGEWIRGSFWDEIPGALGGIAQYGSCVFHHVDLATLGQFTGLFDKNGKKIFEGDVFKFPDEIFESYYTSCGTEYNSWETENCGVVGYDEYYGRYDFVQYRFENNAVEADLRENKDIDFADFVRELEVIGNIHDNPELLKEETDG